MTSRRQPPGMSQSPSLNGSSRSVASVDAPQSLVPMLERKQPAEGASLYMASESRGQGGSTRETSADWRRTHTEPADDDERVPLPTAWRTRPVEPAATGWLARQIKAGLLGLALGLALVVPTVLWLTGRLGDETANIQGILTSAIGRQESPQHRSATAEMAPTLPEALKPVTRSASVEKHDDAISELLARAEALIADGEMQLARDLLSDSLLENNARAAFALAETFDPNILAATGARGVRADVERARMLYDKALAGGIALARQRLDALR